MRRGSSGTQDPGLSDKEIGGLIIKQPHRLVRLFDGDRIGGKIDAQEIAAESSDLHV